MTEDQKKKELSRLVQAASRVFGRHLRSPELQKARNTLRRKGWTQAEAARQLGVAAGHLCLVLNGHRISHRLIKEIAKLPENPNPA